MNRILETKRLYLRELNVQDAIHFYNLNLDEEVLKYTGDRPFINVNEAKMFLKNYDQYDRFGFGRWAVIRILDDTFLGWCGLKYSADLDEVDIGFRFFKRYWNDGYATESAKACLNYGFSDLNTDKIIGRVMKENISSIRVLEKIGMNYDRDFDFDGNDGAIYEKCT